MDGRQLWDRPQRLVGLLPADIPIIEFGYLASEFRGTLNIDARNNECLPTFFQTYFEFAERDAWESGDSEFLGLHELDQGGEYYIFVTTPEGLYRYDMNDIVRVTGIVHETPTLDFVQKGKGTTSITGEKADRVQALDAVPGALSKRRVHHRFFILIADEDAAGYTLFVEADDHEANSEADAGAIACDVESRLCDLNVEYEAKLKSGRLIPLQVRWLRRGTDDQYRTGLRGVRPERHSVQVPASSVCPRVPARFHYSDQDRVSGIAYPTVGDSPASGALSDGLPPRLCQPRSGGEPHRRHAFGFRRSRVRRGVSPGVRHRETVDSGAAFIRKHADSIVDGVTDARTLRDWAQPSGMMLTRTRRRSPRWKLPRSTSWGRPAPLPSRNCWACPGSRAGSPYSAVLGESPYPAYWWQFRRYWKRGFRDFKVKVSGTWSGTAARCGSSGTGRIRSSGCG